MPHTLLEKSILAGFLLMLAVVLTPDAAGAQQTTVQQAAADSTPPHKITFQARLTENGAPVETGVEWRVFGTQIDDKGHLPLLAEAQGGTRSFEMTDGEYYVHAAYGYAGAVKRVIVSSDSGEEIFTLNAGAMQLNAVTTGDVRIPSNFLRFDVYSKDVDQRGEHQLIARKIRPGEIVPFHAGIYHVVSKYGNLNAEIRADLRVEPGKVTQATSQHHAARMTFRLVRSAGGDAIADTAWSIIAESGDVITESSSAFPTFVLSEGNYSAIAKNNEKLYTRDFKVISGVEQDIEVLIE
jgi:hypothetical protein